MTRRDDLSDCTICMGSQRVMVGMSYPPESTIKVKCEYEPCPQCQEGPHSFWARRTAQILVETRRRALIAQEDAAQDRGMGE